jgi:hypothetical protein
MAKAGMSVVGCAVVFLCAAGSRVEAACCLASCIGPVPWVACFADTTSCNTLQCVGGQSTSIAVDAAGVCGMGPTFGSCPPTEVGRCNDQINNDGWVDAVTDAADPDCAAQAPANPVPIVGTIGIAAIVVLLLGVAALRIRRLRHGS